MYSLLLLRNAISRPEHNAETTMETTMMMRSDRLGPTVYAGVFGQRGRR
jgi:hypothetical protein